MVEASLHRGLVEDHGVLHIPAVIGGYQNNGVAPARDGHSAGHVVTHCLHQRSLGVTQHIRGGVRALQKVQMRNTHGLLAHAGRVDVSRGLVHLRKGYHVCRETQKGARVYLCILVASRVPNRRNHIGRHALVTILKFVHIAYNA